MNVDGFAQVTALVPAKTLDGMRHVEKIPGRFNVSSTATGKGLTALTAVTRIGRERGFQANTFGNSRADSQRDSGLKPRVARHELPWDIAASANNPNGVAATRCKRDATPLGLESLPAATQGSSFLATLGWQTQSLWDWRTAGVSVVRLLCIEFPKGIRARGRE